MTIVEKIQKFLLREFEKVGVTHATALSLQSEKLMYSYIELCNCPEDLDISQIETIMNWLEIKEIKIENKLIITLIN